jgi:hypothetical protein
LQRDVIETHAKTILVTTGAMVKLAADMGADELAASFAEVAVKAARYLGLYVDDTP